MEKNVIHFSRHAKRRMKLYDLSEEIVSSVIASLSPNNHLEEGKHEILSETKFSRQGYPIKVVFSYESGTIRVITASPLKKGLK